MVESMLVVFVVTTSSLVVKASSVFPNASSSGDSILLIGETKNELGGSEYFEYIHEFIGGKCPAVDFKESKNNMNAVLSLIKNNQVKSVHDCSKGGLGIAISEICIRDNIGCTIELSKVSIDKELSVECLLFSESHSRYLLTVKKENLRKVKQFLSSKNINFGILGKFTDDQIIINYISKPIIGLRVDKAHKKWYSRLGELITQA